MLEIKFETDDFLESLEKAVETYKQSFKEGMDKVGANVLNRARENSLVKYDTGLMEENSTYAISETVTSITTMIGFMEFYSIYVHQGTGIYAINRDGRQTSWWWKGTTEKWQGWHKTVGQKPAPFLQDALDEKMDEIPFILQGVINND